MPPATAAAPLSSPSATPPAPEAFWDAFAAHSWERRAAEVRPFPGPALDPERVFQTVVRWCELRGHPSRREMMRASFRPDTPGQLGEKDVTVQVRFLLEGWSPLRFLRMGMQYLIPRHYLPLQSDGSFQGYHRRVSALLNPWWRRALGLPPRRFGVIFNNLEKFDPALWEWGRDCLRPLYQRVGMNNSGNYLALFIGDYAKTAFGVHLDPESVFHVPLVGPKAMRTWSGEYTTQHPQMRGALEYGPHLPASTFVRAQPGEAVYWPSCDWHISESQGGLSVSVALSLTLHQDRFPWDDDEAPPPPDGVPRPTRTCLPFNPQDLDAAVRQVPADLVLTSQLDLRGEQAHQEWVGRATALGFINPPQPAELPAPAPAQRLVLTPGALLATAVLSGGERVLGANGHTVRSPHPEGAAALLAAVRGGRPFVVGELLASLAPRLPETEGLALLHWLRRTRALQPA